MTSDEPWRVAIRDVEPPAPLANQALVSVVAFAVDHADAELLFDLRESCIPGGDVAGVVLQPAADGSGPPRGARVVGRVDEGAWAERVVVPSSALAVVPPEVTLVQAVASPDPQVIAPWHDLHGALEALQDQGISQKAVLCISSGDVLQD
ncbi:hypothetical protein LZC95_12195 [Pendulispora brunnea]|uniref:Alcohol dehydrogenase-like N-terminal domain-containing protein n=1 Tax=Pendulispora brunnea TaxID=2905690 RepID=A0ABZ2KFW9_9BACT